MRPLKEIKANPLLTIDTTLTNGFTGEIATGKTNCTVIYTREHGKCHVSISHKTTRPTKKEIEKVKNLFWGENETVMQKPPAFAPNVVHLWGKI